MLTDPIADMFTRIRNANLVKHDSVLVPLSKVKLEIARILKSEGLIADYTILRGKGAEQAIKIQPKYTDPGKKPIIHEIKRVSKPGRRIYIKAKEIPRLYGGLKVVIISTPKGIMTGRQARKLNLGGEFIGYVW